MRVLRKDGHVCQEVHLKDYSEGKENNEQGGVNQVGLIIEVSLRGDEKFKFDLIDSPEED